MSMATTEEPATENDLFSKLYAYRVFIGFAVFEILLIASAIGVQMYAGEVPDDAAVQADLHMTAGLLGAFAVFVAFIGIVGWITFAWYRWTAKKGTGNHLDL